ncbi:MAG: hypothetical protein J1F02_10170 [Lachnospiraceae bacterium]|nr:hypothetical protein [Lachnospiraceae bacterium]
MRKHFLKRAAGLFLACGMVVSSMQGMAASQAAVEKAHTEKNLLPLTKGEIGSFYVTNKGKLRAFTTGRDDVQSVYQWTGKKFKNVKDPMSDFTYSVNKKKFTGYTAPAMNKKGTAYYIADLTKVYKYNKKGKVTAKVNLKKKLNLNTNTKYINDLIWLKKDLVAIDTWQMGGESGGIHLVDLKKKKIVRSYAKKYNELLGGANNVIYVSSGKASAGNEQLHKLDAASGKVKKTLSTKSLRDLGKDCTDKDDDYGYLKDASFASCVYDGKLYLKYLTGVYVWNESKGSFGQVIDGSSNFSAGKLYGGRMQFASKNKLYVIGYRTDSSSPTDFYEYTIQ